VERALAARGAAMDEAALAAFLDDYGAHPAVESRPFPGVVAAVQTLLAEGWRLAVCTLKPAAPARALLAALGFDGAFAAIGGGDSFPVRKPDPGHVLATLAAAGGTAGRAVMTGDHANDVAAARGAGIPCLFAGWGYGPPHMAAGAAAIIASATELPSVANALIGSSAERAAVPLLGTGREYGKTP
jgi:phosphoglycolate phosphatase